MASSILEIFRGWAEKTPDALCVVDAKGEHTYGQMYALAGKMAHRLTGLGVTPQGRVMALCNTGADYLSLDLACWLAGAIFVPVEEDASEDRIKEIFSETAPSVFVTDRQTSCDEIASISVSYESLKDGSPLPAEAAICPRSTDTAEILFTTGTTGKSKGVEITHGSNVALAENIAEGVSMREGNVELLPLPLSHSHAIRCSYANFLRKGCLLLVDGVSGVKHIYDLMRDYHATAMDLSPTAASVLMKLSRGKFSAFSDQLDYIQVGTAYLSDEVKENLKKTFPNVHLYNFYGSTESGRSCVLDFSAGEDRRHCIGRPTKHARFIVTDEDHRQISSDKDHMGLLACAGAMNMKGYWKQKELTDSVMKDGYIYSKDEGYIDSDGYVYVLGRADDVINFRGIKIAPDEIEEAAADFPGVRDCACIPRKDRMAGQIPVLAIDAEEETFDKKALMQYLRDRVDANKMPQKIVICHEIPRSFNGKLKRKQLAVMLGMAR